jgi:nucleoside-diphosphate-sugar epimerase
VLIAGPGYVGGALAERLVAARHEVILLRRRSTGALPGAREIEGDLTEPGSLSALPECDAVAFTAGPDQSSEATYRRLYVEGLTHLLEALRARGAAERLPRVVMTSSTAVYGQSAGEWVDEETPATAKHWTGACLLEAEGVLRASGFPQVVLRLGGIYGPGRERILDSVMRGEARIPEGPTRWVNRNHRTDCARALEHLLFLERPETVYLGTDSEPADQREFLGWLARELGAPQPVTGAESRRNGGGNKRCRNARLLGTGFTFAYPTFREGYGELIAARRARAG